MRPLQACPSSKSIKKPPPGPGRGFSFWARDLGQVGEFGDGVGGPTGQAGLGSGPAGQAHGIFNGPALGDGGEEVATEGVTGGGGVNGLDLLGGGKEAVVLVLVDGPLFTQGQDHGDLGIFFLEEGQDFLAV